MQSSRLNVTVAAAVRTQEEEASMRQDARVLKAMAQENVDEGVYAFDVANNGLLPYFFAVSFRQQPSRADVPC